MEKFLVTGLSSSSSSQKLQLILPKGKHFEFHGIKNGEADLKTEALLDIAAKRRKSKASHLPPRVFGDLPRTLQHILSRYPYPLSQGPVVFPLDLYTTDKYKYELRPAQTRSESDVLTAKTLFSHDVSQPCYEWCPAVSGVTAWGTDGVVGYSVADLSGGFSLVGSEERPQMRSHYRRRKLDAWSRWTPWWLRSMLIHCCDKLRQKSHRH